MVILKHLFTIFVFLLICISPLIIAWIAELIIKVHKFIERKLNLQTINKYISKIFNILWKCIKIIFDIVFVIIILACVVALYLDLYKLIFG